MSREFFLKSSVQVGIPSSVHSPPRALEEYHGDTDPNLAEFKSLPTEVSPLWILGAATAIIAIAVALTFLWRRRK